LIRCELRDENESQKKQVFVPLENEVACRILKNIIIQALSAQKSLSKQAIIKEIKKKLFIKLSETTIDLLLDELWFEGIIIANQKNGKFQYRLTEIKDSL
jgi:predicted transcriptional regulator